MRNIAMLLLVLPSCWITTKPLYKKKQSYATPVEHIEEVAKAKQACEMYGGRMYYNAELGHFCILVTPTIPIGTKK